MTLIFAKGAPDFAAVADITLSSEASGSVPKELVLPLHGGPATYTLPSGAKLVGHSQKMTIFGRTLIQWAGSYIVALTVVRKIYELSNDGNAVVDVGETIKVLSLNESEKKSFSLTYFFMNEKSEMLHQYWECRVGDHNGQIILAQGSGVWDWFEDTKAGVEFDDLVARSVLHVATEAWTTRNYDFLYGGWFEIAFLNDDLQFEKLQYGLKFWHCNNDGSVKIDLPTVYSSYHGHDLVITSIFPQTNGSCHTFVNQIEDFVRRHAPELTSVPLWKPNHLFHIVSREKDKVVRIFCEMTDDQSFWWEIGKDGPSKCNFKKQFIEMISQDGVGEYGKLDISKQFLGDC